MAILEEIDKIITSIVSMTVVGKEQKEKLQESLFKMVVYACVTYECDGEFRKEIDILQKYFNIGVVKK